MLITVGCVFLADAQSVFVPAQLTGPQSPTRDTNAVKVIQASIAAMEGQNNLTGITKVQSTWNVSDPNSPGSTATEAWNDDWSAGFMVFTHQITNDQGVHVLSANTNHVVQDQEPSRTTTLPQTLQDIALPWCLPAAALQFESNNPAYKIEYLGLKSSTAAVRITRIQPDGFADLYSIQTWQIDLTTGLPSGVKFFTEDLTEHAPYPQTVQFNSYEQTNGLEVPTILLFNAAGHPVLLTLKSIAFN